MHRRSRGAGREQKPVRPVLSVAAVAGAALLRGALYLWERRVTPGGRSTLARRALEAETRAGTLEAGRRKAEDAAAKERARNSFLLGISHDLRGPLAAIIEAGVMLAESGDTLPGNTRRQLAEGIASDAQWLLSMVDNTLSLTRIQGGELALTKTEEAAEELAAQAVARFRRRHPGVSVTVNQNGPLLLVPVDTLLIAQVLGNLLDNAAHALSGAQGAQGQSPAVSVTLARENGFALFTVADNGPGLSPRHLSRLNPQPLPTPAGPDADPRGHGMGLSICRAIVRVHGGWMRAENPAGGGAHVTFALPVATRPEAHAHGE